MNKPLKKFFILMAVISFLVGMSSSVKALDPPTLVSPSDGSSNYSTTGVAIKYNFTGTSTYLQIAFDTTPSFNSPLLQVKVGLQNSTTISFLTKRLIGQRYFFKARIFKITVSDTSAWTAIASYSVHGPVDVGIDLVVEKDYPDFKRTPSVTTDVELLFDTTDQFNSSAFKRYNLASTVNPLPYAPINNTKYFYRFRTYTYDDTTEWSDTRSFTTKFKHKLSISSFCSNDRVYEDLVIDHAFKNVVTCKVKIFSDSNYSKTIRDTTYLANGQVKLRVWQLSCNPLYIKNVVVGAFDSTVVKYAFTPCLDAVTITPFQNKTENFLLQYQPCQKEIVMEFDTSPSFNSGRLYAFNHQIKPNTNSESVNLKLPQDPINYYWRYKVLSDVAKSEWIDKGRMFAPTMRWEDDKVAGNVNSAKMNVYVFGLALQKKYQHRYEYWLDTSILFNSPKLHILMSDTLYNISASVAGILYAQKNYLKMRIVSPNGASEFTTTLVKNAHLTTNLNLADPPIYDYPFYPLSSSPTPAKFQFSKSINFDKDAIDVSVYDYNMEPLEANSQYWVRAKAFNLFDSTEWFDTFMYNTKNTKFVLDPWVIYPKHHQNGVNATKVDFQWQPRISDNSKVYYLQIFQDTVTANNLIYYWKADKSVTSVPVIGLKPNTRYFWTVDAVVPSDKTSIQLRYHEFNTFTSGAVQNQLPVKCVIYPNPTTGILYFNFPEGLKVDKISVWNSMGVEVYNILNPSTNGMMNIADLASGVYILRLHFEDASVEFGRIQLTSDR